MNPNLLRDSFEYVHCPLAALEKAVLTSAPTPPQARVEEAGQALLWLTSDENGTAVARGRNSPREAYEEVRTHSCRFLTPWL